MLILCPNCRRKSRVKSPPASITTLKIRCAVCKHVFVPTASDVEEEASGPVATATESGFRQTTRSIDVSDLIRQSFVGPNPLRGQKTDVSGVGGRAQSPTFATNPSLTGGSLRVKTDVSLSPPSVSSRPASLSPGGMSPRVVASTPPPAPVVAPPAQGAPQSKTSEGSSALSAESSATGPRSRSAMIVSVGAALLLSIGLVLALFVVPRLPGWSQVGRGTPDPVISASSEVPGVTLTGAQFISWGANEGPPILVVLGSAKVEGPKTTERPDVLLRIRDAHGEIKKETRVPLGVSSDLIDVVRESTSDASTMERPWLRARASTLGPLKPEHETGFRIALALPPDAPESYSRELRIVARGVQPASK